MMRKSILRLERRSDVLRTWLSLSSLWIWLSAILHEDIWRTSSLCINECTNKFDTDRNKNVIIYYTDSDICQSLITMDNIVKLWYVRYIYVFLIISKILLFLILRHDLKRELDFYFQKTKNPLKFLVLCWVIHFGFIIYDSFGDIFDRITRELVIYLDNFPTQYSILQILMFMLFDFWSELPLYLMAYYNIKNIDFKLYLYDIMASLNLIQFYDNASIFIK